MGRKKKRFIDKKKAQTFHLVARSQADPLYQEPGEAQHVLKPVEAPEGRLQEQQSYGIFYDDDYNYLQHLKVPGTAVLEPVGGGAQAGGVASPPVGGKASLELPSELFGSEVTVAGHLSKVTPLSGPQPGWDPDIVAALDSTEMTSDPEEQLEDDFILKANGGELDVPVYITTEMEDGEEAMPWWHSRGDFQLPGDPLMEDDSDSNRSESVEESGSQSDPSEEEEGAVPEFEDVERKTARFTEYSISSSVVPRNDALTLLDEKFEHFMVEYDDTKLGSLEDEVEATPFAPPTSDLLEQAVRDFQRHLGTSLSEGAEDSGTTVDTAAASGTAAIESDGSSDEESSGSVGSDRELLVMVGEVRGDEQWDCESILSTYSNLYNHPTKISEPRTRQRPVKLSNKTGVPLGVIPGPAAKEREAKKVTPVRPKEETPEEKKMRKLAIREERKYRRAEKKTTRVAFKSEQLRQEKAVTNRTRTTAVV